MARPALFFHADAVESEGKDLVGRRSSGQSFLRAFLENSPGDALGVVTETRAGAQTFRDLAQKMGETRHVNATALRGEDFTQHGTIFFPGPGYLNAAWRRQRFGPAKCSLVGITHTVSTRRVMEGMHRLMTEPVEDWDAIICTSRAVHSVVACQFEAEAEFMRQRFGATRVPMPQLPIIPLGIHTADFVARDGARAAMRDRFGAPDDAIVVMTMGRLTSVEKANPAPMLIALQEVVETTGLSIHLWQVGWSSRDEEAKLHRDAAKHLAPGVAVQVIDGRDADVRRDIWAGADIFTLPVDNIQETFGLVPVEAMAAGLPVVMPDWNGFRDTVLHGETGFLIPTRMPPGGQSMGRTLATRFADGTDSYLRHLSLLQQQTQMDVRAYVNALTALSRDRNLRAQMGQAGQRHVQRHFDWRAVFPQYLSLADELAARRAGASPATPPLGPDRLNPLEIDPFTLYAGYPSAALHGDDVIISQRALDASALVALDAVNGRTLYGRKTLADDLMVTLARIVMTEGPMTVADLARVAGKPLETAMAAVMFLAKYDYVIINPEAPTIRHDPSV